MASIDFKQLDNISRDYVNWSNKHILDQCKIIPINNNETIEKLQILAHKNSIQRKIADDQHKKLTDIYFARSKSLAPVCKINDKFSEKDMIVRRSIVHCNAPFEEYSDLDILLVSQKYRENKYIITIKEQISELNFIKRLVMVTKIQRLIIDKQLLKIVSSYQTYMYAVLSKQYLMDINGSNLHLIQDRRLLSNLKLLDELWKQKERSIYNLSSSNRSLPTENMKIYKLIKKTAAPQVVSQNCCVCFENIKFKIGLVSCGHTAICEQCASNVDNKKCPICMTSFTQFIKIFD